MLRKNNFTVTIMIAAVVVLLALYSLIKFSDRKIEKFTQESIIIEKALKQNENTKTSLKLKLEQTNSKGFIEKQARMEGFIMPDEECFKFINPEMLDQGTEEQFEWIVPEK